VAQALLFTLSFEGACALELFFVFFVIPTGMADFLFRAASAMKRRDRGSSSRLFVYVQPSPRNLSSTSSTS
jgi:hypothetical protein